MNRVDVTDFRYIHFSFYSPDIMVVLSQKESFASQHR